jgi:hypothetical protein
MPKINRDWVTEQLKAAKVRAAVSKLVIHVLKAWEEVPETVKPEDARQALDVASKLALGHSLVAESGDEVWMAGPPGFIRVGDEVRVMADAFDGPSGQLHNGRRGKAVAIRSGDVIFNSTDGKLPTLNGTHYSPFKLEKRVR